VKVCGAENTFCGHLIDGADTGIWNKRNLRKKTKSAQVKVDGAALCVAPSTHASYARFYPNVNDVAEI
jgi:hypothetical protein